jgi:hypothetical protein
MYGGTNNLQTGGPYEVWAKTYLGLGKIAIQKKS